MDTNTSLKGLVEADTQDAVEEVVEHKAKPKEVAQKKGLVGAVVVEWVDSKKLTFVRSGPQGFEEVKLEAGDSVSALLDFVTRLLRQRCKTCFLHLLHLS